MSGQQPARGAQGRRRQLAQRERKLEELAAQQHLVISRRQLLDGGLSVRTIERRVEAGRLRRLHRGVYFWGPGISDRKGRWLAAVLACGRGALLSHRSAATLWGLMHHPGTPAEVTASAGRRRPGIVLHEGGIPPQDRAVVEQIPVTTVARTLFDLAEVDEQHLQSAAEEADRLRLLDVSELEAVCARCPGRRALRPVRLLIDDLVTPVWTRTRLEDKVISVCREYGLPMPSTNVLVLGHEVDALWPNQKLIVEADSAAYHRHRAVFERDRKRDAARQVEGYRVIRLTHRRLEREPAKVADELRRLLNTAPGGERAGS
jgi:predicted transcriptional regulator of viral defense system